MRILYAFQGTGNGHHSRAQEFIPILQTIGEVDVWVSGGDSNRKFEVPVEGIIDHKIHRGTPRKLMGCSISGIANPKKKETWEKFKRKRLLLAIGGEKGQQLVDQFKSWGWKQPEDFVKLV